MPAGYTDPPELTPDTEYFVRAFYKVHKGRKYSPNGYPMQLGLDVIKDYVDIYGRPYDIDFFVEAIFTIDELYLPKMIKRMQAEEKKRTQKPSLGRPRTRK